MQKELTPEQIASMSEVMAEYMGYRYNAIADIDNSDCGGIYDRCKVFAKIPIEVDAYPDSDQYYIYRGWFSKANENGGYLIDPDFIKWDWIHEVWEKVKNQKILLTQENIIEFKWHRIGIETCIINNLLLKSFTALFNCIEFINKLKQQNENNKSI